MSSQMKYNICTLGAYKLNILSLILFYDNTNVLHCQLDGVHVVVTVRCDKGVSLVCTRGLSISVRSSDGGGDVVTGVVEVVPVTGTT